MFGKKKILVVDDEESMLAILDARLKHAGFNVDLARNAEEAMGMIKKSRPQLVLLDIMMPGADGFEVLGAIRKDLRTRSIPVMMLTSKSEKETIQKALSMGARDYIAKPFNPVILIDKVKKATNSK